MSLLSKLQKNSTIKDTAVLQESKFFNAKDLIQTPVPMINVALSGKMDGGLAPGLTVFAGPSKHFKTAFALMLAKAYMDKYEDAVVLFYDSEFGSPQSYFDSFGIDTSRVLHTPITDIEQLKHDSMQQLNGIERGDHVIVIVDSVGNLASKKEVEDALEGKSVADMTRAKQLKSLFRMVYYSADNIFIIGRQQEKDGQEIVGYNFIINVEKSRYVREKSRIPVEVTYEGGISRWSGLLDVAQEGGFVFKPSNGWYSRKGEEQKFRLKDTYTKEFWMPIISNREFREYVETRYHVSNNNLNDDLSKEDIDEEYASLAED
jgi:RecA/RadA recombinase